MLLYDSVIKKKLSPKRYIHSINVAKSAGILAEKYGADPEKAKIAGILHDITKEWSYTEHMNFVNKYKISVSKYEILSKKLLHSLTGSFYIKYILKIGDPDIINSVRYHTTAHENMSMLEKIVYISDFISEDRTFYGVERLRNLANKSMQSVITEALGFSIAELVSEKRIIHPNTLKAYNQVMAAY
ncbi:MAG: bis(5'-nucleosyl)-tetraphosphatase (symmetrical) YqeK [Candidatus Improbicoccus devescovinae]|nr:MAG: bis(5'-nucleosyl)-tetraphosphatase (symmetrical) YqeK [Candidatus Improbicoccus devescovinae]